MSQATQGHEKTDTTIESILDKKLTSLNRALNWLGEDDVATIAEAREALIAWESMDAKAAITLAASWAGVFGAFGAAVMAENLAATVLFAGAGLSVGVVAIRSLIAFWQRKRAMVFAVIAYRDEKSNALSHH